MIDETILDIDEYAGIGAGAARQCRAAALKTAAGETE